MAAALWAAATVVGQAQAPSEWLLIEAVDSTGRRPLRPDAVFEAYLAEPGLRSPAVGDELVGENGSGTWREYTSPTPGKLAPEGRIGWAFAPLEIERAGWFLAKSRGAARFFLDGVGYFGDPYAYGFGGTPVWLDEGVHELFVTGLRGAATWSLEARDAGLVPAKWDALVPDIVLGDFAAGRTAGGLAALELPLLNLSRAPSKGGEWRLRQRLGDLDPEAELPPPLRFATVRGSLPELAALARAPLSIELVPGLDFRAATEPETVELELFLFPDGAEERVVLDAEPAAVLRVNLVAAATTRRVAFRSGIDGSLQEYGLVVPTGKAPDGLVLSLHGAGVGAMGQARSYAPKEDLWIAAALNRRPFGFDWQDWGRLDAYEALAAALAQTGIDDERVFLTGHSMGGHGTWHLGVNDPDRFLGIAPSAGWATFDTYGGRPEGALSELWQRADGASLTLEWISNLVPLPVYVLHGTADDNVPVSEAEHLITDLRAVGGRPEVHFQEGAGHWWGAQCVDWPPIFELFRQTLAGLGPQGRVDPDAIDFWTTDPGVDSRHFWVEVLQPRTYGQPVHVLASWDASARRLSVQSSSAGALRLSAPNKGIPSEWVVDGQTFRGSETQRHLWVQRDASGRWALERPAAGEKQPGFSGPFKRAFEGDFLFVFGTAGDAAEDAVLLETGRYLQADWSYRAAGEPELVSDVDFLARGAATGERHVILLGNRDTNAAWGSVLGANPPLDVHRGGVRYGTDEVEGEDLLALFVLPRVGGGLAGVFGSSGPLGARLTYEVPVFVSGVGLPDWTVLDRRVLASGDGGVVAAGYFDRRFEFSAPSFERPVESESAPR